MKLKNPWSWIVYVIGVALFLIGLAIITVGAFIENEFSRLDFLQIFLDVYGDIGTGFIDTSITVLIIDTLYRLRENHHAKLVLLRSLRSKDNSISAQALDDLASNGWLRKRTLRAVQLSGANLQNTHRLAGLDLSGANLIETNLSRANLHKTIFTKAVMNNVNLEQADLPSAKLNECILINAKMTNAVLQGANLEGAILLGADLTGAKFEGANLINSVLPDGSQWSEDNDFLRFTQPEDKNYWRSNDPKSPAKSNDT